MQVSRHMPTNAMLNVKFITAISRSVINRYIYIYIQRHIALYQGFQGRWQSQNKTIRKAPISFSFCFFQLRTIVILSSFIFDLGTREK